MGRPTPPQMPKGSMTRLLLASVAVIAITVPVAVVAAPASVPATPSDASSPQPGAGDAHSKEIVVTGHRFDIARDTISPALGASKYTFDRQSLQKQPGGANTGLDAVLLQAPGVTQDSYGVVHVRNEHANLQYRLNGVI